jgi:hypothetical protein
MLCGAFVFASRRTRGLVCGFVVVQVLDGTNRRFVSILDQSETLSEQ